MTTQMRLLPVRVSPALRGLIDEVGAVNPGTRALLILGAAAAGLELRGLEREVAALLSAELTPGAHQALRRLFGQLSAPAHQEYGTAALTQTTDELPEKEASPAAETPHDPFATIGVEV